MNEYPGHVPGTQYEARMIVDAYFGRGISPQHRAELCSTPRLPRLPTRRVRVVAGGWFGPHGRPVETGETFELADDEARGAAAFGRAEIL